MGSFRVLGIKEKLENFEAKRDSRNKSYSKLSVLSVIDGLSPFTRTSNLDECSSLLFVSFD